MKDENDYYTKDLFERELIDKKLELIKKLRQSDNLKEDDATDQCTDTPETKVD